MRQSTIFLHIVCMLLGLVFIATGLFVTDHVLVGGLVLGALMCLFAALLGADQTTNTGPSRAAFKVIAAISSLPLLGVGVQSVAASVAQSDWGTAAFTLMKLLIVVAALALLAIDSTPTGRKLLRSLGFSAPNEQRK
jgi:hypothetical protein